mmetsp:Transcript_66352/g.183713  ORF Transcript_66352/g.183713 Transcript_66352/m.183713 type:complete len:214 (-) Transcript_66352:321-962(-)
MSHLPEQTGHYAILDCLGRLQRQEKCREGAVLKQRQAHGMRLHNAALARVQGRLTQAHACTGKAQGPLSKCCLGTSRNSVCGGDGLASCNPTGPGSHTFRGPRATPCGTCRCRSTAPRNGGGCGGRASCSPCRPACIASARPRASSCSERCTGTTPAAPRAARGAPPPAAPSPAARREAPQAPRRLHRGTARSSGGVGGARASCSRSRPSCTS